jgi:hypothetical protein
MLAAHNFCLRIAQLARMQCRCGCGSLIRDTNYMSASIRLSSWKSNLSSISVMGWLAKAARFVQPAALDYRAN